MADYYSTLIGKPQTLPYDISSRQAQIARKRKLAEALQLQALKEEPYSFQTGGGLAAPNFAGPIVAALNRRKADQMNTDLDKQESAVAEEEKTGTKAALTALTNSLTPRQGMAQDYGAQPDVGGMTGGLDEQDPQRPWKNTILPPEPMKGAIEAIGSGYPEATRAGTELFHAIIKSKGDVQGDPSKAFAHVAPFDPRSRSKILAQYGITMPAEDLQSKAQENVADGVVVVTKDGKIIDRVTGEEYSDPYIDEATGIPMVRGMQTGKTHALTGGNVTPVEARRDMNISKVSSDRIDRGMTEAQGASQGLRAIKGARDNLANIDPRMMGAGADFKLGFAKALRAVGVPAPDTASLETLQANMGTLLIDRIRAFAPVTEQDIAEMKKIIGSQGNTPEALHQILDIAERRSKFSIESHNNFVKRVGSRKGAEAALDFLVDMPDIGGGPAPAPAGAPQVPGAAPAGAMPQTTSSPGRQVMEDQLNDAATAAVAGGRDPSKDPRVLELQAKLYQDHQDAAAARAAAAQVVPQPTAGPAAVQAPAVGAPAAAVPKLPPIPTPAERARLTPQQEEQYRRELMWRREQLRRGQR